MASSSEPRPYLGFRVEARNFLPASEITVHTGTPRASATAWRPARISGSIRVFG